MDRIFSFYSKHKVQFWLGVIILQQVFLLFSMDGTGGDGDSVNHYLYNKYAFKYPWLFIHSWSRPFFVLASCLFVQLGFIGIKLFNSIMAVGGAYLAYRLAKKIDVPRPELVMPLLMFMPDYLQLSLSGLTEPLFSFMVVGALLIFAYDRNILGALIVSFLPFARPEGFFFVAIAVVYFIFRRGTWKMIPLLLIGHIFYSLVGFLFFDESILWLFKDNANATLTPAYGVTGRWLHYVRELPYVIGIPICVLFWLGAVAMGIKLLLDFTNIKKNLIPAIVLAGTFSVIIAHTIFWKFGLFKSFGLTRNLLTVAPLMAIISLVGMQTMWSVLRLERVRSGYASLFVILGSLIFLYSGNKCALKFPDDFQLNPVQELSKEVVQFIDKVYPKTGRTFHYYPFMNLVAEQDPFDWKTHKTLFKDVIELPIPGNTIVIWDDWFALNEGKVTLDMLVEHPELEFVKAFDTFDQMNKKRRFVLFKTKIWY